MRLIDADALKDEIIDLLEIEWGYEGIREDVSRIIDSMPTVEERPHGEWEKKPEICYDYFYCSGCGYAYKHAFNFCPNCGLPMTEKALEILRKRERR